jgi:hypothetical protein
MRRALAALLAGFLIMASVGADSCQKSQSDLNKASQGLDALNATCADLQDPKAASSFDKAAADAANRSDQPLSQTIQQASASRQQHCSQSSNPQYKPYTDVETDLTKP